jgi:serine/threonine protein kinase/Flp pilus assembly protein TadD
MIDARILRRERHRMSSEQLSQLNAALERRYVLAREIGHGGMATVFLGRDVKHQRDVALKVFRPEVAAFLGSDRFRREIELAANLSHPHILPLHDSGEADDLLFYVMPYVQGETLRHMLEREKRIPFDRAIDLIRQVASALDYAHARGVIHRDIKPENILLHENVAVVADFGIALALTASRDDRLTEVGLSLGTPAYMSPEQSLGERELDARSDIYSLGSVLFEMLAGEPPFTGASALSITAKRLTTAAPDVRRLRPEVPASIARAVGKALAREPDDRFATAGAFAAALTQPAVALPLTASSVAVLPFLNLSADPENEYFADGITEDIIANLSKVRALRVISRSSVMRYKGRDQSLRDVAARLEATAIVDGSVRRIGDRVRIVAELIDAAADRQLWAETYDRQLTDVFAIQTDVALRIADALRAELSVDEQLRMRREPTHDVQAYQLYLQGRHCLARYTGEGLEKAIWFFERALEMDSTFAIAQAGVALAYVELGETGVVEPELAYPRALKAVNAALALDGELAEAHVVLGSLKAVWQYDWAGAEREFRRALELSPSNANAHDLFGRLCSALGRQEESIAMQRRAQQLDPLEHRSDYANSLLRAGRYEEGLREAQHAVEFDPHYDRLRATLGWALVRLGRYDEGIPELEMAVKLTPTNTAWTAQLGQVYAEAGRIDEANDILRTLTALAEKQYVSPYHMAYVLTGLGRHDEAIDWLERAYEQRAGAVYGIKGSFLFEALRTHPRFVALLRKMNLA